MEGRRSGIVAGVTVLLRSAFFGPFQYQAGREKPHRQNPSGQAELEHCHTQDYQHSDHDYRTHS